MSERTEWSTVRVSTDRALADVGRERDRQISKGWTPKRDDEHTIPELAQLAELYLAPISTADGLCIDLASREQLVKVAALAVATVESIDRRRVSFEAGEEVNEEQAR